MKSRGVYESPAATVLYAAHRDLVSLVIDRETLHYRLLVAEKYAELVYNGQWFTPIKESLDVFINHTERLVTGTVRLKLYKGNVITAGRKSPNSLFRHDFATFEEDEVYNQADAEGFINLFGLPERIRALAAEDRK